MGVRLVAAVLLVALGWGCANGSASPTTSDNASSAMGGALVHYEVRLRDGGHVPVSVDYSLPSGESRTAAVDTPWRVGAFSFMSGSTLRVRATTREQAVSSPLLCVLVGTEGDGAWTLRTMDEPLNSCHVSYELGEWPPDNESGPLIKVGD